MHRRGATCVFECNIGMLFGIGIGKMFCSASKSQIENEKRVAAMHRRGASCIFECNIGMLWRTDHPNSSMIIRIYHVSRWRCIEFSIIIYTILRWKIADNGKQHVHFWTEGYTKKTNGVISSLLSFILPWLPEKMAIGHEAIRDSLANFFYSGWCLGLLLDAGPTSAAAALFLPPFPAGVREGLKLRMNQKF